MHLFQDWSGESKLTDIELEAVSVLVESAGKAEKLVESMEIRLSEEGIHTSLRRWSKRMTLPTRPYFIRHLRNIGMREVTEK